MPPLQHWSAVARVARSYIVLNDELDRSMSGAYEARGLACLRSRQYEKAVLDFSRTMEFDPANAMAYVNRGLAYLFLNREQEAEADFRIAVSRGIDTAQIEAVKSQRSVK